MTAPDGVTGPDAPPPVPGGGRPIPAFLALVETMGLDAADAHPLTTWMASAIARNEVFWETILESGRREAAPVLPTPVLAAIVRLLATRPVDWSERPNALYLLGLGDLVAHAVVVEATLRQALAEPNVEVLRPGRHSARGAAARAAGRYPALASAIVPMVLDRLPMAPAPDEQWGYLDALAALLPHADPAQVTRAGTVLATWLGEQPPRPPHLVGAAAACGPCYGHRGFAAAIAAAAAAEPTVAATAARHLPWQLVRTLVPGWIDGIAKAVAAGETTPGTSWDQRRWWLAALRTVVERAPGERRLDWLDLEVSAVAPFLASAAPAEVREVGLLLTSLLRPPPAR